MTAAAQIEDLFHACFNGDYRTRLQGGASEPLYQPADVGRDAVVFYRADYVASALHEVAHWCIAGRQRREREDYGYWYAPEGRSAGQQRAFERVERRPQALEWHFAVAAGVDFRLSLDNLQAAHCDSTDFARAVVDAAQQFCRDGLPPRAQRFRCALAMAFGGEAAPGVQRFSMAALSI